MGGCSVLGDWLDMLPDGTYPNITIVQEMLHCIDSLLISSDDLTRSNNLGRVIKQYANGNAEITQV